ncbi:MAG: hypothetical protein KGJ33_03045 [Patescibacteria group bacterium]|nr:hypothetical protein [Patescibacteria group bacterium]
MKPHLRTIMFGLVTAVLLLQTVCLTGADQPVAEAATQTLSSQLPPENVSDSNFSLVVCDGPPLPASVTPPSNLGHTYRPCDFNAAMIEAQHAINIFIVFGVLAAIFGFCYIGYLYITGSEKNISRAKEIFPKIFIGFIIMISAWFIVYQILGWLAQPGARALLGN